MKNRREKKIKFINRKNLLYEKEKLFYWIKFDVIEFRAMQISTSCFCRSNNSFKIPKSFSLMCKNVFFRTSVMKINC